MPTTRRFDASARTQRHAPGLAIVYMVAAGVLITLNNTATKAVAHAVPLGELIFFRGLTAALLIALWLRVGSGSFADLKVRRPWDHFWRGVLMVISMFAFIAGVRAMPLVDVQALVFIGPVLITAMAPFLLGERVGWHRWSAVLVGFAGVIVMLRPGAAGLYWIALLPLASALASALRDIMTRRMSAGDTSLAIEFYTQLIVVAAATAAAGWIVPAPRDLGLVVLCGVLLTGAHVLMIESLRFAEAVAVAPFRYLMLIWTGLLGFAFFGEIPDLWAIAGSALIVASGLYVIHRETRRRPKVQPQLPTVD